MRALNANLNTTCLGARSSTYYEDYYGAMGGINEGLPSDRLLVDWFLDHPSVVKKKEGRGESVSSSSEWRVPLPSSTASVDPLEARLILRESLRSAFAQGAEVVAFDTVRNEYLLQLKDSC